jgi:hypothetical protein
MNNGKKNERNDGKRGRNGHYITREKKREKRRSKERGMEGKRTAAYDMLLGNGTLGCRANGARVHLGCKPQGTQ